MDGIKHVLGIWIQAHEGAKFWAGVCAELANRGIRDVLIVCCDGLTGLPEAIEATWTQATVQTCVVHLIRASMRFVNYKDRKAVAAALKPIYTAADVEAARIEFESVRRPASSGKQVSARGGDLEGRLGAVHPVPGLPARVASGHLHHELDRVAELPAAQDHQEPRPLPQRPRRRQAAVARHLQHRGQTSPTTRKGTWQTRRTNAKPPDDSSRARSSPTGNKPSSSSHSSTPTASTPTSNDRPLHRQLDRLHGRGRRIPFGPFLIHHGVRLYASSAGDSCVAFLTAPHAAARYLHNTSASRHVCVEPSVAHQT